MVIPARACPALAALGAAGLLALLATLPLTAGAIDGGMVVWLCGVVLPTYATGLLAWWKRPDLPISRLLLGAGSCLLFAEGLVGLLEAVHRQEGALSAMVPVAYTALAFHAAGVALGGTVLALFPDGRPQRAYERIAVRVMWLVVATVPVALITVPRAGVVLEAGAAEEAANPLAIEALSRLEGAANEALDLYGLPFAAGVVLLAVRYRRLGAVQRAQVRWLLIVALTGLLLSQALWALPGVGDTPGAVVAMLTLVLLPVTVLVAILRYRVLDVDLLIRRSLVYGVLWAVIAAAYVAAAAALGIAAGERLPVALAVLLTVVATLVFQPARRHLERLADRWAFGERLGGYELLARFGSTLEETFDPDELFARLAETVKRGLRVSWARVLVRRPTGETYVLDIQAAAGIEADEPATAAATVALAHAGEPLGLIEVGPKQDGALTAEDRTLLETLARQAAIAIRNARLASELSVRLEEIRDQAQQLRASRKRILQAQDGERRRIERDIHDGVQQELVALIAGLRLARNQRARGIEPDDRTFWELQEAARQVLEDLRALAQGIHPSVLSDHGLVEAIQSRAARMPVAVAVRADPAVRSARFPDDVEAAAYFVVSEALANALKHAGARRVEVTISHDGSNLELEVADDGCGFEPAEVTGSGLANMDDRLEALGGRLTVRGGPGQGARINAGLPASVREHVHA